MKCPCNSNHPACPDFDPKYESWKKRFVIVCTLCLKEVCSPDCKETKAKLIYSELPKDSE